MISNQGRGGSSNDSHVLLNVLRKRMFSKCLGPLSRTFLAMALCRYVADWAVRTADDDVLEPSCGEAAFLLAAGDRLDTLARAAAASRGGRLDGVELHESSARRAETLIRATGHEVRIQVSDFFLLARWPG